MEEGMAQICEEIQALIPPQCPSNPIEEPSAPPPCATPSMEEPPVSNDDKLAKEITHLSREIDRLSIIAGHLEDNGRRKEADEIFAKIEALGEKLEQLLDHQEEKGIDEIEKRIIELYSEMNRADEEGDYDLCEDLKREIIELKRIAAQEKLEMKMRKTIEAYERKLSALHEKAELFKQKGDLVKADQCRNEADLVSAKLEEIFHKERKEHINLEKEQLARMLAEAEIALKRGESEKSRVLTAEAQMLKQKIEEIAADQQHDEKVRSREMMFRKAMEKAERLQMEGREEDAEKVRRKAEQMSIEIEEILHQREKAHFMKLIDHIKVLKSKAHSAKKKGDLEKAERYMLEVRELEHGLQEEKAHRERMIFEEEAQTKLRMWLEAVEAAERNKDFKKADKYHERIAAFKAEMEQKNRDSKIREYERALQEFKTIAEKKKQAGQMKAAEEAYLKAKQFEKMLREKGKQGKANEEHLIREIKSLKDEIRLLRKEMDELKKKLNNRF